VGASGIVRSLGVHCSSFAHIDATRARRVGTTLPTRTRQAIGGLEDTSKRRADLGALRLLLPENGVLLSLQQRSPRGFGSDSGSPETAHGERRAQTSRVGRLWPEKRRTAAREGNAVCSVVSCLLRVMTVSNRKFFSLSSSLSFSGDDRGCSAGGGDSGVPGLF
jgi:hypothetical protein